MRFINLVKYPIDKLSSEAGRALVGRCHAALASHGFVALDDFMQPEATAQVLRESEQLEEAGRGFYSTEQHNIFLSEEATSGLRQDHPRMQEMSSSKLIFPADELSASTPLREIHEWPPMVEFIKAALKKDALYPSACPLGKYYVNTFSEGDQLGWHFDNSEFSINLIMQPAEAGGAFEYAPRTREVVDAMDTFPHVNRVSERLEVLAPPLLSSSLYLFHGRHSLHRVSPVVSGKRVNAILAYNSGPDERLNEYTLRKFFGRTEVLQAAAA